ncbi:MAG: hypothetical protein ACYC5O_12605 [Anaerolineae bacterium]
MPEPDSIVLPDVLAIQNMEYPDIFSDALSTTVCYGDEAVYERSPLLRAYRLTPADSNRVYGAISAVSGRGWLIGFDEAAYYRERGHAAEPAASFAVAGLGACLEHHDSLWQAISLLDRVPEPLWNDDCEADLADSQAAGFVGASTRVESRALRRYVTEYLATHRRPLIALLHLPHVPVVEFGLLTGYESCGDVILGRSPYLGPPAEGSGPDGYFRMRHWEPRVLAVIGIAQEKATDLTSQRIGYLAIENDLRLSVTRCEGTRHYGLVAYDAWARALLDDGASDDVSDEVACQRLQHHSITAGYIACQKAFCVMPEVEAPSMGVVTGYARRAAAGPGLIHGLMWDAWQAVGGYWRGVKPDTGEHYVLWTDTDELRRFRDPDVRARAAAVVRRAREVDAQALDDLATAKREWDTCRGHGGDYPCPCWQAPCVRV